MTVLLLIAKVGLVFVLACVSLPLLRRRSAWLRHRVISIAFAAGLLLPLLTVILPQWRVLPAMGEQDELSAGAALPLGSPSAPGQSAPQHPESEAASPTAMAPGAGLADPSPSSPPAAGRAIQWTVIAWAVVATGLLLQLLLRVLMMSRFVHRAPLIDDPGWLSLADRLQRELGVDQRVELRFAHGMPLVWGVTKPVVMLPASSGQWSEQRRCVVLGHELAHIAHRDVLRLLMARVVCALYWFVPLAWLLQRRQVIERERACDDVVLAQGIRPEDYAGHLLDIATTFGKSHRLAPILAARHQLEGRIMTILDRSRKTARPRRTTPALTAIAALLLVPLATLAWSGGQGAPQAVSDSWSFERRLRALDLDVGDLDQLQSCSGSAEAETRGACIWALGNLRDPRATDTLIGALEDRDPTVRQWAARGLQGLALDQRWRPESAERAALELIGALDDTDDETRQWVVRALADLGDERAIAALAVRANDPDPEVRQWIVRTLATVDDDGARESVISRLNDSDPEVRQWAVRALSPTPDNLQDLLDRFDDEDAEVRQWAVRIAANIAAIGPSVGSSVAGDQLEGRLIERLEDSDSEVREWAARSLAAYGDPGEIHTWRAVDLDANSPEPLMPGLAHGTRRPAEAHVIQSLVDSLQSDDANVREWAVRSLGDVGDETAVGSLIERTRDSNPDVREWAARALGSIRDATATGPLLDLLADQESEVREWAVRSLGVLQDERMVVPLLGRFSDPSPDVREWAARALGAYGDTTAIGPLTELLEDPDEDVRSWAKVALQALRS